MNQNVIPTLIKFHKQSQQLELAWSAESFFFNAELLRVLSPSAEVRGHGVGNAVLQYGKKEVRIQKLEAIGNYALKIYFDDGHDSGLFNWAFFQNLAENQEQYWQEYLEKLNAAGKSREPASIQFKALD